jgi:N-hydroxyarylamine O-acetyltransferase
MTLQGAENVSGTADAYLRRIGVKPARVSEPDFETLARLQEAHVRTVPFETLSITGDPRGVFPATGVSLGLSTLYEKIVESERGGYCFELNGLFCWLLTELGYDVERIPARVLDEDGDPGTPANHHSILVHLDQPYVVDVGLGTGKLRQPVPLETGTASGPLADWRVVESDRPEETHLLEYDDGEGWDGRYVCTAKGVPLSYFRAANDYLQAAAESPFTGDPFLSIATEAGYVSCSDRTLRCVDSDGEGERSLSDAEWYDHLEAPFGLSVGE